MPNDWLNDNTVDRSQAHSPDGRAQAFLLKWPSQRGYPTFLSRKKDTLVTYRQQAAITTDL